MSSHSRSAGARPRGFTRRLPTIGRTVSLRVGSLECRCVLCLRDVLLYSVVPYTGHVVRMERFSLDDWFGLSVESRRCTMNTFFSRPKAASSPVGDRGNGGVDKDLEGSCPTLANYLGSDTWPDGEVRQRSSMVIFYEDGVYKMCLSERDTNMTLWAASKDLLGLFGAMEARLTEPVVDWRKQRQKGKRT